MENRFGPPKLFAPYRVNLATGEAERLPRAEHPALVKSEAVMAMDGLAPAPAGFEHRMLQDVRAELEIEGVPEPVISVVEHLASGRTWGLCDPMYMANVVAFEFGWGTGRGEFGDCTPVPDMALSRRVAERLYFSYTSSFAELGVDGPMVFGRILAGLKGAACEAADEQQTPDRETPRGA